MQEYQVHKRMQKVEHIANLADEPQRRKAEISKPFASAAQNGQPNPRCDKNRERQYPECVEAPINPKFFSHERRQRKYNGT